MHSIYYPVPKKRICIGTQLLYFGQRKRKLDEGGFNQRQKDLKESIALLQEPSYLEEKFYSDFSMSQHKCDDDLTNVKEGMSKKLNLEISIRDFLAVCFRYVSTFVTFNFLPNNLIAKTFSTQSMS